MHNEKKIIFILLSIMIAGALTACGTEKASTNEDDLKKAVPVTVSVLSRTTVNSVLALDGKVKPVKEVNINTKATGRVEKINFEIGDVVKKGDILFVLEQKDIKLQVSQAEAVYKIALATFNKTKGGSLEQQDVQLKSAYETAKTNYEDAKLNYERTQALYDVGGVSKQGLESAQSRYKIAQEQYNSAKVNYELTKSKINPENISTASAQVDQAKAGYEMAKSQFENTIVRAPIDGVITSSNVRIGEMISGAVVAMNIADLSSVTIDVGVTEQIINKIRVNDSVAVEIGAVSKEPIAGFIKNISPVADSKTQAYSVKIAMPNKDGIIKGGMFAKIKFNVDKVDNALGVPIEAIVGNGDKKVVFVQEGSKAVEKEIQTGISSDKLVEVKQGLNENDKIIIKGQSYLQDGSKIEIVK